MAFYKQQKWAYAWSLCVVKNFKLVANFFSQSYKGGWNWFLWLLMTAEWFERKWFASVTKANGQPEKKKDVWVEICSGDRLTSIGAII